MPFPPDLPVASSISPVHLIDPATSYGKDPATLAKQILIVAARHRTEPALNSHLAPLLAILPEHILPRNADLSTLRWDLVEKRVYARQASGAPRFVAGAFAMTQDSTPQLKRPRTTTMAQGATTPGSGTNNLAHDDETRTPGIKFKKFDCYWLHPKCPAVLHNCDTLWKHVLVVHGRQKELRCFWGSCTETAVMDKETWEAHVKCHVEDVRQVLGNGPAALESFSSTAATSIDQAYLYNYYGEQVTPVAYPSSPTHKFRPPAGFTANKQFKLAHAAYMPPKQVKPKAGNTNLEAWNTALNRARSLGSGIEGSSAPPISSEEPDWWSDALQNWTGTEQVFEIDANWP
ncbi:hypothetical protein BZA77DRAFT_387166 [Pyronema omphalodes]|nr:hypothetical protein BZA77DRAFT_387166 [Pyronema omphalodes]